MTQLKPLFTVLFLTLFTGLNAQFSKGDRMVGTTVGNIFFSSGSANISVATIGSNVYRIKGYNIAVNPALGWFISENTAVGATLNINPYRQKETYEQNGSTYKKDQNSGFNFGAGGFVRSYFAKSSSSFLPFGQASLNGGLSNRDEEGFEYTGSLSSPNRESYDSKSSGGFFFNAGLTAGVTKMLGENAGLDFFIGYVYSYTKSTAKKTTLNDIGNDGVIDETFENETTTKFTSHGFQAGVGFQVFLRRKK